MAEMRRDAVRAATAVIENAKLTEPEKASFRARGLLHLPGILPTENADRSREEIIRLFEKHGFWKDGRWHQGSSAAFSRLLKRLKKSTDRGGFMTPCVRDAMAELVDGAELTPWSGMPELLFSRPGKQHFATDRVPEDTRPPSNHKRGPLPWHVDVPRLPKTGIVGVQMFTFLDSVEPGGGGTAAVTGSHRLLNDGVAVPIKDVNRELGREPFFRDVLARDRAECDGLFETAGRVQGVDLEVVELVGEPGDVYLMNLQVLHSRNRNTGPTPRLMITQRFLLSSVRGQIKTRYYEPPKY